MAKRWKTVTIRFCPDEEPDASILDYLDTTPKEQIRKLWISATTPVEERTGTLGSKISQLRNLIEKTDSDYLLRKMTEEEYLETLKSISGAISVLEMKYGKAKE